MKLVFKLARISVIITIIIFIVLFGGYTFVIIHYFTPIKAVGILGGTILLVMIYFLSKKLSNIVLKIMLNLFITLQLFIILTVCLCTFTYLPSYLEDSIDMEYLNTVNGYWYMLYEKNRIFLIYITQFYNKLFGIFYTTFTRLDNTLMDFIMNFDLFLNKLHCKFYTQSNYILDSCKNKKVSFCG